jgi:mannose-6-phosphate isomerase-like protein (cupin superfamily)
VVEGTGRIVIDGYSTLLRQNETLTIPTGRDYRIENPGKAPLTLIEVITGPYLGDDDITVIETGLPAKESAQG